MVEQVTRSGKTSDNERYNEWKWMVQQVTTNDKKWQWVIQRVKTSDSSGIMNENGTVHFKEGWSSCFQWQKQIPYFFKRWMAAIRVVK